MTLHLGPQSMGYFLLLLVMLAHISTSNRGGILVETVNISKRVAAEGFCDRGGSRFRSRLLSPNMGVISKKKVSGAWVAALGTSHIRFLSHDLPGAAG